MLVPAFRSGEASRGKLSCSWPLYPFSLFSAVDHRYYVLFLLIAIDDMMCSILRNPFVIINQLARPIPSVGHELLAIAFSLLMSFLNGYIITVSRRILSLSPFGINAGRPEIAC